MSTITRAQVIAELTESMKEAEQLKMENMVEYFKSEIEDVRNMSDANFALFAKGKAKRQAEAKAPSKFKRLAIITHLSSYRDLAVHIVMVDYAIAIDDEIGKVSLMNPERIEEYYESNVTGIEKTLNEIRSRADQLGWDGDKVPAIKDIPEEKLEAIAKDMARAKTIRFLNEPMERPRYMSGLNPRVLDTMTRAALAAEGKSHLPRLGEDYDDILAREARNEAFSKVMSPEHAQRLINDLNTLINVTDDQEYCEALSEETRRLGYIASGIVTKVEATVSTKVDFYPLPDFMKGNHDE